MPAVPQITVPDKFFWIDTNHDGRKSSDTQVVALQKPGLYERLDLVNAEVLGEYRSILELFGHGGRSIRLTFYQNPNHLSFDHPMYPMYYELLDQIDFSVCTPIAFQLLELPILRMSLREIHQWYCLKNRKIPFDVCLYF